MLRTSLGVLAGAVVAWLLVMLSEFAGASLFPPAATTDLADPSQLAAHIQGAPLAAMLAVLAGWTLAAFAGGWVAAILAKHRRLAATLIGALVLAGVIATQTMIPHPAWMAVAGVLLPLPAAWLGSRLVRPRRRPLPLPRRR